MHVHVFIIAHIAHIINIIGITFLFSILKYFRILSVVSNLDFLKIHVFYLRGANAHQTQ